MILQQTLLIGEDLDPALLPPSRFEVRIKICLPMTKDAVRLRTFFLVASKIRSSQRSTMQHG
jgi:ATP-dependent 26S proteasome regulatory subunit